MRYILASDNDHEVETTQLQRIGSSIQFAAQKKLIFFSNDPSGSASRLIELHAGGIIDRPSISFFDYNNRHVVSFNCHDTLPAGEGGQQLKQIEIKTLADPGSPNPNDLRTRLGIQYDQQRITWGATFTRYFEINQNENPILSYPNFAIEDFGLRLRTLDSLGSTFVAGQFLATIDAADNVTANLDVRNNDPTKTAQLIIGRNTTVSGASGGDIVIKKMDGSNTTVLALRPRTTPPLLTLGYTGDTGFNLVVASDTGLRIGGATTEKIGFYGVATPVAKQTVSGAKGANAALGSLMTALAALGLVVDSTTA